jgi:hypothetical protein
MNLYFSNIPQGDSDLEIHDFPYVTGFDNTSFYENHITLKQQSIFRNALGRLESLSYTVTLSEPEAFNSVL